MPKLKLFRSLLVVMGLCVLCMSHGFAFNKHLWPIWEANNPLSKEKIDHSAWQAFLDKAVVTNHEHVNLVTYNALTKDDLKQLNAYLDALSKIDIDNYHRDEQLAYWINLYNALTVSVVAKHYPVASIQDINISPGLFSVGPWGAKLIKVTGTSLSLEDIHNRIIRAIWNDPRTHYAINNGSIGSPNLSKTAFLGECIEEQLNDAAKGYINSLRGVQLIDNKLIVSKIYEWFVDDFGGSEHDIIRHMRYFANPALYEQLKGINSIEGYVYNWHLNGTLSGR